MTNKFFGIGIEREVNSVSKLGERWTNSIHYQTLQGDGFRRVGNNNYDILLSEKGKPVASFHNDGSIRGFEIQSGESEGSDWKQKTLIQAISQIRFAEKKLYKKLQPIAGINKPVLFPFGTVGENVGSDYHGSYHFSLTLPVVKEESNEARKLHGEKTLEFARQLQWIEPLLISKIGGARASSINDGGKYSEGSERTTHSNWGGALGSNVNSIKSNMLYSPTIRPRDEGSRGGGSRWWSSNTKIHNLQNSSSVDFRERALGNFGGIELRFMDGFDSRFFYDYAKTIVFLTQNKSEVKQNAYQDADIGKAMARVAEEGYNAYLPVEYINKVEQNLGITFTAEEKKIRRASNLMNVVARKLWEKNKNDEDVKLLLGENNVTEPRLFNVNKASFGFHYRRKLAEDAEFRKKHEVLLKGLLLIDSSASNGFISSGTKGKGFKHLIQKTEGKSMSSEDTRDMIDFLETHELIITERNEDGSIEAVKINYSNKEEALSKLNKLVADKSFYEGKAPEPFPENYESDEKLLELMSIKPKPEVKPVVKPLVKEIKKEEKPIKPVIRRIRPVRVVRTEPARRETAEDDDLNRLFLNPSLEVNVRRHTREVNE